MTNKTDFRKTVETGLDSRLLRLNISILWYFRHLNRDILGR